MSLCRLTLTTVVVFITTEAASDEYVKKAVGGTVSFGSTSINPNFSSIVWKHRSSSDVIKVIESDVEDGVFIPNQRFKDIATLDNKTGQITITNLTVKHSGLYTIEINSKEQGQRFNLEVMERVPKPEIKIEKIKINPDVLYLICEYSETIIWRNSTGDTLKGSKNYPTGESLTVENKGNPENFYTCTLENGVSEATSDRVYERDLFHKFNTSLFIAIAICLINVVIIIIVFIIKSHGYCAACCRRTKTSMKLMN